MRKYTKNEFIVEIQEVFQRWKALGLENFPYQDFKLLHFWGSNMQDAVLKEYLKEMQYKIQYKKEQQ